MKNLIEEIEKLKLSDSFIIGEYSFGFTDGKNKGIKQVLELLDQYNIITAPKSIKLSEIMKRLKKEFNSYKIFYDVDNEQLIMYECRWNPVQIDISNGVIELIGKDEFDYPKWLYTLWIAGTEIIDDLKENE